MHKAVRYVLLTLGGVGILALMVLSFFRPLWVDPSVIMVEMERLAEGYVPYRTMHLNYPPFWFYLMIGLKTLFHIPYGCYVFYLAIHYLFCIGSAFCVYGISREFGVSKWLSLAAAWFFLFISMWLWGDCVIYDIPTAFWGLLASYLVLKFKERKPVLFVIFGFVCALSFLTKQFGAGFLPLAIWLIITSSTDNKILRSGFFCIGYLIPIAICLLIWGSDFINSTLLNGYGGSSIREIAGDQTTNVGRYLRGLFFVCTRFPMIILAVLILPLSLKSDKWKQILFCLFGIGGFALQFCFITLNSLTISGKALHYLLLLAPFIAILTALLATSGKKIFNVLLICCLAVTCLFSAYKLVRWTIPEYFNKEDVQNQKMLTEAVNSIVGASETAWVVDGDLEFLYYTANLKPAVMEEVAYSTGFFEMTAEKAKKEIKQVDYVIQFDWEGPSEYWRNYYDAEVQSYVESFPKTKIGERNGSDVVVYSMKGNQSDDSNSK